MGIQLQEKDCAETVGLGLEQVVERRVLELVKTETRPMPGALAALELVRSLDWKIGLATASDRALIEAALSCLGAKDYFHHMQSEEAEKTDARLNGLLPLACNRRLPHPCLP